jgi:hypothetical protein
MGNPVIVDASFPPPRSWSSGNPISSSSKSKIENQKSEIVNPSLFPSLLAFPLP